MKQVPIIPHVLPEYRLFFLILLFFTVCTTYGQPKEKGEKISPEKAVAYTRDVGEGFSYKIYPSGTNGFGYDILYHHRTLVHQPSIPGMPGNNGFRYKKDADKVARLVIHKIHKNIMPPTVIKQEMDSLKIKW